ncbi:hypothetical protein SISNIDRAFT_5232 [Sistotremastrum niveocremeum HHB9708]|uniref:Uncharacterized protein n=1 Tax=Sistotremastrum niveocremeum HHB9708 TaxID=1314777 RepID=A0A165AFV8_9AGAM|nr:hypothetical protein SISNIDRAFT_5232 [Sistotremastrum niveocremeum HHB9708]
MPSSLHLDRNGLQTRLLKRIRKTKMRRTRLSRPGRRQKLLPSRRLKLRIVNDGLRSNDRWSTRRRYQEIREEVKRGIECTSFEYRRLYTLTAHAIPCFELNVSHNFSAPFPCGFGRRLRIRRLAVSQYKAWRLSQW